MHQIKALHFIPHIYPQALLSSILRERASAISRFAISSFSFFEKLSLFSFTRILGTISLLSSLGLGIAGIGYAAWIRIQRIQRRFFHAERLLNAAEARAQQAEARAAADIAAAEARIRDIQADAQRRIAEARQRGVALAEEARRERGPTPGELAAIRLRDAAQRETQRVTRQLEQAQAILQELRARPPVNQVQLRDQEARAIQAEHRLQETQRMLREQEARAQIRIAALEAHVREIPQLEAAFDRINLLREIAREENRQLGLDLADARERLSEMERSKNFTKLGRLFVHARLLYQDAKRTTDPQETQRLKAMADSQMNAAVELSRSFQAIRG